MIDAEFRDYLASAGFGTVGTDLFRGDPDPSVDNCLWVVMDPSDERQRYVNTSYATISVWGRNTSTTDLATKMEGLDDAIHGTINVNLPGYHIYFIHTLVPPQDFDRDENRRKIYMMKFRIIYRGLNELS